MLQDLIERPETLYPAATRFPTRLQYPYVSATVYVELWELLLELGEDRLAN